MRFKGKLFYRGDIVTYQEIGSEPGSKNRAAIFQLPTNGQLEVLAPGVFGTKMLEEESVTSIEILCPRYEAIPRETDDVFRYFDHVTCPELKRRGAEGRVVAAIDGYIAVQTMILMEQDHDVRFEVLDIFSRRKDYFTFL